ncbi:FAD-linked oxidase C-terminal domain-containing protein [Noviherbaspirillum suwonense]|uniref:D-lactate dehydrogenase (cytochrome) n=1 Tax=Noviherbaspirillum suwonense TaxID=1224511 RepID=A0ABY1Q6U4_9BURK|nr:FAD-linked oxidase C-terminal domain-containing protein [Noviherbaspirillum suwonense]SMP60943.1 D-lactate dehydrogenase (cytochrome) [Noviherbaspirillum suwonense]
MTALFNRTHAGQTALPAQFQEAMSALLEARFTMSLPVREHHGKDESPFGIIAPDAVAFVNSTDEVAAVIRLCGQHRVPVIPFGAGTSIEGHFLAPHGGISLDLSGMNAVIAVHAEDLTVTVQAGVLRKQLNEEIKHTGLFFPIDPGADASIGGMCATRASGTNAVRYQTMRENVLALTVVTPEGKIIQTGTRARKSSAGYDLTRVYVGSEGTLGIITEVTLRVFPQPEALSAAVCAFPTVASAVQTVIETIQMGVPIARVEFVDALSIRAINRHDKLDLAEMPTLFFEFHGSASGVAEQAETVQQIAAGNDGHRFEWATHPEDRKKLWNARHSAYFAALQLKPGCKAVVTDVCVPISRLAECVTATDADLQASSLPCPIVGHVGDGNFHVIILIDPHKPEEREEAEGINARIVERALAMEGTCTGEHGIGMHKKEFLRTEQGDDALDVMRAIKRALDPMNLLNPGKIFELD